MTPATVAPPPDRRIAGILLMMATVFLFVGLDTLAKLATERLPVVQTLWARYFFALVFVVLALGRRLPRTLRSARPTMQMVRGVILMLSSLFFFNAIHRMPLAEAMTIGFVSPLLLIALSGPILGETVPLRRWLAVAAAFAGVIVVMRPGSDTMTWASLLPLGTAGCFAVFQILTRLLNRIDPPETTMLWTTAIATLASSLVAPWDWIWPTWGEWGLLASLGLVGVTSHWLMIKAFERAPASALAPFSYTQLPWGILMGWLVFADLPDHWTLIGGAVIVGSGLYVLLDERRMHLAAKT